MALSQSSDRGPRPQSVANLTLAQVTLEALRMPNGQAEKERLRVEQQQDLDDDPFRSARGIVNGLRLSVTLWSFIALVVLLTR